MSIDTLFDRMDAWRHFPNYQLERRADLFFSLYLPQVLQRKFNQPFLENLIPEFPVHLDTINSKQSTGKSDHKSVKIDYVAISTDGKMTTLVELKTDMNSINQGQYKNLLAAKEKGLTPLLQGLVIIFQATNAKRKYFRLLEYLHSLGLITIPAELSRIMARDSLQGANAAANGIKITSQVESCEIVYVLPKIDKTEQTNLREAAFVTFAEFRAVVAEQSDPLSQRFARSLEEWALVEPGKGSK